MKHLVETLRLLALPASDQRAALPSFVVVADEIALLFSDELAVAASREEIPKAIADRLRAIDAQLEAMSNSAELWTDEALQSRSEWKELRTQAGHILVELGEPLHAPDLAWVSYSKAGIGPTPSN